MMGEAWALSSCDCETKTSAGHRKHPYHDAWDFNDLALDETMNALAEALPHPDPDSIIPDDVVAVQLDTDTVPSFNNKIRK